jgi:glycosyltransferase involved in cell wall biosynthesis
MINNPLVSIIIPTFNRGIIVKKTLQSVLNQTYTNWECLIIDDGSNLEEFNEIHSFSKKDNRFRLLQRPDCKLKGANACRNYGIEHSIGEFIIFFDSDDLMALTCLENRVNTFKNYKEYDYLVFSMGHFIEESNCYLDKDRKSINLSNKKTIEEFLFSKKLPWNVCRPIFKSEFIKYKIWFNENMQNFQDDEFNVRVLVNLKPKYKSIDITDSYYRIEDSNINKYNNSKGKQNILNSFYEYLKTIFEVLETEQILIKRNLILGKIFSTLTLNISKKTKLKFVFMTIKLLDEKVVLSFKEFLYLYFVIFLNKFYFNKKGYYKITQYFKNELINE